jgi:hypothetical protein
MEPGLATLPPPNSELSPDEERALREAEAQGYEDHDPEGDPDTDVGNLTPTLVYCYLNSLVRRW